MTSPVFAFIPSVPVRPALQSSLHLTWRRTVPPRGLCPARPRASPRMLQSPTSDGPPDLSQLEASQSAAAAMTGPTVELGTHRATASSDLAVIDAAALAADAARNALASLQGASPLIAHVSVGEQLSLSDAVRGAAAELDGIKVLGRGAPRKGTERAVEVLILGGGKGVGFGAAETEVSNGDIDAAASTSAKMAVTNALEALGSREENPETWPAFAVFTTSPGGEAGARNGFGGGVPAYGGAALVPDAGVAAGVAVGGPAVEMDDGVERQRVGVALIAGKTSFLVSAVVKAWAQPAYVETLPFLIPKYKNDAKEDLLTAIRYDDWERFQQCLEGEDAVEIDVQWETRQHQTPLLAACARGRVQMIRYLLDRGADPKYRNDGGYNAVMYTKLYASLLVKDGMAMDETQLKMLVEAGADPDDVAVITRD